MSKKWDVFISHSSEDKNKLVRELVSLLDTIGMTVWYDEFTLQVGDSLTQKIDQGLQEANFGIVIISKAFLNKKWTDYEYRSLLSREDNFKKVILPIWHDITFEEVKSFSLYLADKFALDTSKLSLKGIALKLTEVIRPDIFTNFTRVILYKQKINESETKSVKVSELKWGEKRRNSLAPNFVNRIKGYYYNIGQNFNSTLQEGIDCYLYDANPEREIQVWEVMNVTYLEFIKQENIADKIIQTEIASQILLISIGSLSEKTSLTVEQLKRLHDIWKTNFHAD